MMGNKNSFLKGKSDAVVGILIALFLLIAGGTATLSTQHMIMKIIIMGLFALSLNVQTGMGGLMPMGHALMFGLGAYSYAVATVRFNINPYLAVLIGLILTVVIALFLGFLLLRKSNDLVFSFLSMGFCMLAYTIVLKSSFLGFDTGISGVPRLPLFKSDTVFYFFTVIVVCILTLLLYLLTKSPFSWIFRACRENKQKANCIGVNIVKVQLQGFVISGVFACLAGMLYTMKNVGAYTSSIAVQLSMEGLVMCILGGMNNFWGPVLGATIVTLFNTQVTNVTIYSDFWLGILTLFVVMFLQGGILDAELLDKIKKLWRRVTRKDRVQA